MTEGKNRTYQLDSIEKNRLISLDIMKGIGIFIFIVWHVIINFTIWEVRSNSILFRSVFFITGYFVFLSGFNVGSYYYRKVLLGRNGLNIFKRILIRSIKLLCIVVVGGVCFESVTTRNFTLLGIFELFKKILSLFYLDRWDISLQVLVVISLTIIVGYFIVIVYIKFNYSKYILIFLALAILAVDSVKGEQIFYLYRYLYQGILGVMFGLGFSSYFTNENPSKKNLILTSIGFFSILTITYVFLLSLDYVEYSSISTKLWLNSLTIICFLSSFGIPIYLLFDRGSSKIHFFMKIFVENGSNSLFVYVLQILIIDLAVILTGFYQIQSEWFLLFVSVLVFSLCSLSCMVLQALMKHSFVRNIYCYIFK